jgi:uncharacterized protein YecE (DUF72 family)
VELELSATRNIRVGCAGLPTGMARERYFSHLRFLETDVIAGARVKLGVLGKWRADGPADHAFSLIVPRALCGGADGRSPCFAADAKTAAQLDYAVAAATALGAEALLFRTPASFSPSTANRTAMARFFDAVAPEFRQSVALVWEPAGVWSPTQAQRLADELDVVYARDPLHELDEPVPLPRSGRAYFRLLGLGAARREFSDDQLDQVVEQCSDLQNVWVVFANQGKFRDARRFAAAVEGPGPSPPKT